MYNDDRGGGLKGQNVMAWFKQETHKKGVFSDQNIIVPISN